MRTTKRACEKATYIVQVDEINMAPIVVVEPVAYGLEHIPFNSAVLLMIRHLLPDQRFDLLLEVTHGDALMSSLPPEQRPYVRLQPIVLPPRTSRFWRRFARDLLNIWRAMRLANRQHEDGLLVLLEAPAATIYAVKLAGLLHDICGGRPRRIVIFLHGVLQDVFGWRPRAPWNRFKSVQNALTFGSNANVSYVVLEEAIRREVIGKLPLLAGCVNVLPHPCAQPSPDHEAMDGGDDIDNQSVKIGFVGLAAEGRGYGAFLDFARTNQTAGRVALQFHAIGSCPPDGVVLDDRFLATKPTAGKLPRDEFELRLRQMDYICLPLDPKAYRYIASGAFLDAVAFLKPIVALRLPFLDDIVAEYGDIGWLCDSLEEMQSVLTQLPTYLRSERYRQQQENLARLRADRSPEALAKRFMKLITQ